MWPLKDKLRNWKLQPTSVVLIAAGCMEAVVLFIDFDAGTMSGVPERWVVQARLVLVLNLFASVAAAAVRARLGRLLLFVLKLHFVIFVGLPYGPQLPIEFFLTLALLMELSFLLPVVVSAPMALASIAVVVWSQYGVQVWNHQVQSPTLSFTVLMVFTFLGILSVAIVLSRTLRRFRSEHHQLEVISEASTQLARVNLNLQSYSAEVERQAAMQERARITRELHDTIGYAMTNQIMLMEVARRLAEKGDANGELIELIEQSREKAQSGLNEARSALHALRAVRASEMGAIDRIKLLIEAFKHTEVQVAFETQNVMPRHLSGDLNYVVYRVAQEGITNAIRHGHANRIDVSLWKSEHELVITVNDNGEGATEIKTGVGFAGIQERIASRGGRLTMRNLNPGFQLDVRIPHRGE